VRSGSEEREASKTTVSSSPTTKLSPPAQKTNELKDGRIRGKWGEKNGEIKGNGKWEGKE
jgi:hypothetical protein